MAAVSTLVSRWMASSRRHPQGLHQLLDTAPGDGADRRSHLSVFRDRLGHAFRNRAEKRATVAENLMASGSRIRDADLAWKMAAFRWKPTHRQAAISTLTELNRLHWLTQEYSYSCVSAHKRIVSPSAFLD